MGFVNGVNLLPATGEFTYAKTAHRGQRVTEFSMSGIDTYYDTYNGGTFPKTDYSYSIDQLQAAFPACTTVAVVCAWFGNSDNLTIANCQIYPATTYVNNGSIINPATGLPWPVVSPSAFQKWNGSTWVSDHWMVSSLTETSSGLIPISSSGGSFTYGGTPSDQSVVECIADLRARGFRVVFYPFILMDSAGKPWRGRITYSPDVSSAATSAVSTFLGSAAISQFTRDYVNNTVSYAGSPTDFTYRRMVLHYANLCIVAGGVDLFLIGSEFRGLETIRGPGWTITGTADGGGKAIWDYPFVAGMITLSDDVRSVFDTAGFAKDTVNLHNLISYAADWSDWMGWQHPGASPALPVADGQWPHLDQLWAHSNIDLVCFDNYMPLSDWTTGDGSLLPRGQSNNLDVANWSAPAAVDSASDYERVTQSVVLSADYGAVSLAVSSSLDYGIVSAAASWPPSPPPASPNFNGLGLTGQATINSKSLPFLETGWNAFFATSGSIKLLYNWFKNCPDQILQSNIIPASGCKTTAKYNLYDDMNLTTGAHRNYLQLDSNNVTMGYDVEFNTTYQSRGCNGQGGEGFQIYANGTGVVLTSPILSNNTMIARLGSGLAFPGRKSMPALVHGNATGGGTTITGTGHADNNYFDISGATDAFYPATMTPAQGWSSSGNIDMNTGAAIRPA